MEIIKGISEFKKEGEALQTGSGVFKTSSEKDEEKKRLEKEAQLREKLTSGIEDTEKEAQQEDPQKIEAPQENVETNSLGE